MPTPPDLMPDAEFDQINDLEPDQFKALPADVQERFRKTADYHAGERQKLHTDGMMVCGRPYAEVLAEIEAQEKEEESK